MDAFSDINIVRVLSFSGLALLWQSFSFGKEADTITSLLKYIIGFPVLCVFGLHISFDIGTDRYRAMAVFFQDAAQDYSGGYYYTCVCTGNADYPRLFQSLCQEKIEYSDLIVFPLLFHHST